jgi:hypothetical protein
MHFVHICRPYRLNRPSVPGAPRTTRAATVAATRVAARAAAVSWRAGITLLVALAGALALAPRARCQPAAADSTRVGPGLAARDWMPHGNYQTNYDVNRTVQTWTQSFATPYSIGKLKLSTNVTYTHSFDSTNDRKTVNRMARTSFNYLPLEDLKLGMAFDVTKNNTETPVVDTRSKTDRQKVLLTAEYKFYPIDAMTTTLSAKTGTVNELLENRSLDRSGRGRNSTYDLSNVYKPLEYLTWSVGVGGDLTSLDSEDSKTALKTEDRNTSENYTTSLDFSPSQRYIVNFSLHRLESQFQYPREDAQETKSGFTNGGDLRLVLKPIKNFSLNLTGGADHSVVDFDVEKSRSTVSRSASLAGSMNYEFLGGTKLDSRLNWENDRNEYGSGPDVPISVLSQAGYLYIRSLSANVTRSLGSKLSARASGSVSLRSYQFDDTENNFDDRDMRNSELGIDLTYIPSKKYTTGVGVSKRTDKVIYISSEKSSNNREGETYTVSANYTYKMSPTTSITQIARMNADYSFYKFAETRNFLIRNTTLHTVLTTRLLNRIGLALIHDYRYQDQGGVSRRGGTVYYGRIGDNDRQDMTVKLDYEPVRGVKIALSQRFLADKRYNFQDDERVLSSENERVELLAKTEVNYNIAQNTTLNGRFERMDSSVEGQYWRVTASFRRSF